MSKTDMIIFVVVAIVTVAFTFISHYFYREYAWWISVEKWVPWLQSWDNRFWKGFLRCVHWFGWEALWPIALLFYCKFNRASSQFLISMATEAIWLSSLLKMIWNDPAPYMDRENINAFECDQNTFQTPSLEVLLAAVAYSGMFYLAYDWIDVFRPRVKKNNRNTAQPSNNDAVFEDQDEDYFLHDRSSYQTTKANDFTFWAWLSLAIFLVFAVGFASMYLGINTIDQVFYAASLGY